MSKNIQHTLDRLNSRGLPYTMAQLFGMAYEHGGMNVAIILGKVQSFEVRGQQDYAILIVRNCEPVTIFTRRTSQTIDKNSLRVERIVYQ